MQLIPISNIIIPEDRQRTEFDEVYLNDLAKSIISKGLLHAPVLRNDKRTLIAGECRKKVIEKLHNENITFLYNGEEVPHGMLPFVTVGDLSDYLLMEAELEENIRRLDLTLQERAMAVTKLHKLRIAQYGEFNPSTGEGWTKTKTAEELHRRAPKKNEINDVSVDILIANNLDDPFVAAAKDKKEALRAIRERKKTEHRNTLLENFKTNNTKHKLVFASGYQEFSKPEYRNKFSVIVTDPPYGIDADQTIAHDKQKHEYDDGEAAFQEVCNLLPILSYTITTEQAHIYVFCDITRFQELLLAFEISGWKPWNRPLIWNKGNIGSYGNIDKGFRKTYDTILFAVKGERQMNGGYRDVINVNQRTDLPHPAGKPMELYKELLSYSALPGDHVADLFCGHGPIFSSAESLHLLATGTENNEQYYSMAVETLSKLEKDR